MPARLRKARKLSGLSRSALGPKVGLDSNVAAYIEAGQRLPTVATIARLASALGVAAGWLAFGLGDIAAEVPASTTEGMSTRLAEARVERNLTKASLARAGDLAPSAYARIETGGQTGVEVIEALAKALDVSPAWLAYNEGPRELPKRRRSAKSPAPSTPTHP